MVIGARVLTIRDPDGDVPVPVRLCAPEYADGHWICRYTIDWPEQPRDSCGAGADALQALHLAMQKIGFDLYASAAHKAGILMWEKRGDGYGFPIPKNGRDLLVGADKTFEG
ncbi:DUF6968 family protein [Methylobacterium oryzae]|uniref:DUF6968 domain-containing protein n=1 Tax=Methylobacterium oryzae TaxID=334852 RepID=A0ABU7TWY9_9HYPH